MLKHMQHRPMGWTNDRSAEHQFGELTVAQQQELKSSFLPSFPFPLLIFYTHLPKEKGMI